MARKSHGIKIATAQLGPLVTFLGVDPRFIDPNDPGNVMGTHNASNDAAYTMMALLFYAVRWKQIVERSVRADPISISQPLGTAHPTSSQGVRRALLWLEWIAPGLAVASLVALSYAPFSVTQWVSELL